MAGLLPKLSGAGKRQMVHGVLQSVAKTVAWQLHLRYVTIHRGWVFRLAACCVRPCNRLVGRAKRQGFSVSWVTTKGAGGDATNATVSVKTVSIRSWRVAFRAGCRPTNPTVSREGIALATIVGMAARTVAVLAAVAEAAARGAACPCRSSALARAR